MSDYIVIDIETGNIDECQIEREAVAAIDAWTPPGNVSTQSARACTATGKTATTITQKSPRRMLPSWIHRVSRFPNIPQA